MQPVNWTRVMLGGLLAGAVINFGEYLLNGVVLAQRWAEIMRSLHRNAVLPPVSYVIFNVWGFLSGLFALWLYATIRARFGAGPRTAAIAGIATWVPGSLLANLIPVALQLYPRRIIAATVAVEFVLFLAGAVIGASVYKARESAPAAATA